MKRVALFLITNLAVLLLLAFIARVFGLDLALARQGMDMGGLLVLAALIGFIGSFISLAISKWSAKHLMGVRVIEAPADGTETWLVNTVRAHAQRAGIGMPEIGVFDAPEMNALHRSRILKSDEFEEHVGFELPSIVGPARPQDRTLDSCFDMTQSQLVYELLQRRVIDWLNGQQHDLPDG